MKNIVVKFKKGHVAYSHNLNGAITSKKLEEPTPFGFDKLDGRPDPGIYNVFWELDKIMNQAITFIQANPTERIQIAVPGQVWALANNLDMMTRMMWTRKCLYSVVKDEKSHRTILLNRPTVGKNAQYPLNDAEFTMYKNLFFNMKKLMGFGLVVDSQFTCSKAENAKTPDAIAWYELNQACNQLLEIGTGDGANNPWGNMTGTDAFTPQIEDEEDAPF